MTRKRVIALAGAAGSGKGTAAKIIKEKLHAYEWAFADPLKTFAMRVFGFTHEQCYGDTKWRNAPDHRYPNEWRRATERYAVGRVEFATQLAGWASEPMSYCLAQLDDWWGDVRLSDDPLTPRHVLQTLGTEMGRDGLGAHIWAHAMVERVQRLGPDAVVVISDARFNNEFEVCKAEDWELWHIERAGAGLAGVAGQHRSEQDMHGPVLQRLRTHYIENDGTLAEFKEAVRGFAVARP